MRDFRGCRLKKSDEGVPGALMRGSLGGEL